ncbi:hypothetical protein [Novosphingobium rosa]|uniref:hypothetical protein n=1 Tax=Novosphingobium rosa TaxID=76978 RepID=UPI00082B5848|nr:hypothetical protein [Novosphingobium rosa]
MNIASLHKWMAPAFLILTPYAAVAQEEDPPLMDDPPLAWFKYNTDGEGNPTFLSRACLEDVQRRSDISLHPCAVAEAEAHQMLIERHDGRPAAKPDGDREQQLAALEDQIREIQFHMSDTRRLIRQEHRFGTNHWGADRSFLSSAQRTITEDQDALADSYRTYQQMGGRKSMEEIGVRPR